jgi:hypothetical protein
MNSSTATNFPSISNEYLSKEFSKSISRGLRSSDARPVLLKDIISSSVNLGLMKLVRFSLTNNNYSLFIPYI